jgi:HAD superfamily hydrolase (TIGR01509 family)
MDKIYVAIFCGALLIDQMSYCQVQPEISPVDYMNQTYQQAPHINQKKAHHKYRNIIFDLVGVLVSWKPKEVIASVFKDESEIPWYLEEIVHTPEWLELDRGTMTPEQAFESAAKRFHHHELKQQAIKFFAARPRYITPLPEGLEILRAVQAKGYNTYILSNMAQVTYAYVSRYDFFKTVQGGVYSYQVKMVKPDEAIYNILLKTYDLKPEECLFIDDTEINIAGAQALGIDGIVCNDHKKVLDELKKIGILD